MDEDIKENLKEVASWLRAVANQIGSTKSSVESITAMRDCLSDGKEILSTYLRIQHSRYTN